MTRLMLTLTMLTTPVARANEVGEARSRASYLLGAALQLKWASLTKRYPRVPLVSIERLGDDHWRVDGEPYALTPPPEKLRHLIDARILGVRRDPRLAFLLLQTPKERPTLIWAAYDLRERRMKFLGFDHVDAEEAARRPWPAYLLELRALIEYALGGLSPRDLALDPTLPSV